MYPRELKTAMKKDCSSYISGAVVQKIPYTGYGFVEWLYKSLLYKIKSRKLQLFFMLLSDLFSIWTDWVT